MLQKLEARGTWLREQKGETSLDEALSAVTAGDLCSCSLSSKICSLIPVKEIIQTWV